MKTTVSKKKETTEPGSKTKIQWKKTEWIAFFEGVKAFLREGVPLRWRYVFPRTQDKVIPRERHYDIKGNPTKYRRPTTPAAFAAAKLVGVILEDRQVVEPGSKRKAYDWWVSLPAKPAEPEPQEAAPAPAPDMPPVPEPEESAVVLPEMPHDIDMKLVRGIVGAFGEWLRDSMRIVMADTLAEELGDIRRNMATIKSDLEDVILGKIEPHHPGALPLRRGPGDSFQVPVIAPVPDKRKRPVIMLWNLKPNQVHDVAVNVPEAKIITNNNLQSSGTFPAVDIVLTTKFMTHPQQDKLFQIYGRDRVLHVNGGVTGVIAAAKEFCVSQIGNPRTV